MSESQILYFSRADVDMNGLAIEGSQAKNTTVRRKCISINDSVKSYSSVTARYGANERNAVFMELLSIT